MKVLVKLAISLLLLSSFSCFARNPVAIIDHVDIPVITRSGSQITDEQVRDAITAAAQALHWVVGRSPSQNLLSASLHVRGKHTAVVSIAYSIQKYSIVYQSSVNLNYGRTEPEVSGATDIYLNNSKMRTPAGTQVIHPFYNKWVQQLNETIKSELLKL